MFSGNKLKSLRRERNVTMEELAEALKTTQPTISKYENNIHTPNYSTMVAISNFFNVPLDYFEMDDEKIEVSEELTKSEILKKIHHKIELFRVLEDEIETLCAEYLKR